MLKLIEIPRRKPDQTNFTHTANFGQRRQYTVTEGFTQVTCNLLKQNYSCCQKKGKRRLTHSQKSFPFTSLKGNSLMFSSSACMVLFFIFTLISFTKCGFERLIGICLKLKVYISFQQHVSSLIIDHTALLMGIYFYFSIHFFYRLFSLIVLKKYKASIAPLKKIIALIGPISTSQSDLCHEQYFEIHSSLNDLLFFPHNTRQS